ncbi:MAG: hypothetical protein QXL94_01765 [Candidatus Parvarchaeum sp.]
MVKLFKVSSTGTVSTSSTAKALLGILALFIGFLVREGYTFITAYSGAGYQVVGILFFAGAVAVAFIAVLPFVSNLSGVLAQLQKALIAQENALTPAELTQLKALLQEIEAFLAQNGVTLGQALSAAVKKPEDIQSK